MRRAQEHAQRSRSYRVAAYSLLTRLSNVTEVESHPLFTVRPVKNQLYIIVTSNQGLAGAYDANILKLLTSRIREDRQKHIHSKVITIGKKGANFVRSLEGVELLAIYNNFSDQPTANELRPLLKTIAEQYSSGAVDDVELLYTEFQSNLVQNARLMQVLPATFEETEEDLTKLDNTTFEPSPQDVLDNVAMRLIEVQIWQAILESFASEHSMRMLAMKNATDNASDLIDDLTLEFNTARQAAITQELAEITSGAEAIK